MGCGASKTAAGPTEADLLRKELELERERTNAANDRARAAAAERDAEVLRRTLADMQQQQGAKGAGAGTPQSVPPQEGEERGEDVDKLVKEVDDEETREKAEREKRREEEEAVRGETQPIVDAGALADAAAAEAPDRAAREELERMGEREKREGEARAAAQRDREEADKAAQAAKAGAEAESKALAAKKQAEGERALAEAVTPEAEGKVAAERGAASSDKENLGDGGVEARAAPARPVQTKGVRAQEPVRGAEGREAALVQEWDAVEHRDSERWRKEAAERDGAASAQRGDGKDAEKKVAGGNLAPAEATGELIEAARRGNVESVDSLLRADPELASRTIPGRFTALHWASHGGHLAVVKKLLSVGGKGLLTALGDSEAGMLTGGKISNGYKMRKILESPDEVLRVAWNPKTGLLASTCGERIGLFGPRGEQRATLKGHSGDVCGLSWSSDGAFMVSCSRDEAVRMWASSGQSRGVWAKHNDDIYSVAWRPDQSLIAAGTRDQLVLLISGTKKEGKGILRGHEARVEALAWSPNSQILVSGDADGVMQVWDFSSDEEMTVEKLIVQGKWRCPKDHKLKQVSDRGCRCDICGEDIERSETIWNCMECDFDLCNSAKRGCQASMCQSKQSIKSVKAHEDNISAISWKSDGSKFVTAGEDGKLRFWGSRGEDTGIAVQHKEKLLSVAWSPDGNLIAAGDDDGPILLFGPSGEPKGQLKGHERRTCALCWGNDGSFLTSGSGDETVQLWGPFGEEARPLAGGTALHAAASKGHTDVVRALLEAGGEELLAVPCADARRTGWSASDAAKHNSHQGVAEDIEQWLEDRALDKRHADDERALMLAVLRGDPAGVQGLLTHGLSPYTRDVSGRTALHTAADVIGGLSGAGQDVVGVLIQAGGLELAEARWGGRTAAEVAEFFGNREVAARIRDEVGVLQKAREVSERVARQAEARCREMRAAYDKGRPAGAFLEAGEYEELVRHMMLAAPAEVTLNGGRQDKSGTECKFGVEPSELVCGEYAQAARGLHDLLQVDEDTVNASLAGGLSAMEREIAALGEKTVVEDFHYVTRKAASEQLFHNGMRDKGRAGMRLGDFVKCREAQEAGLKEAEVAALRLYTLPSFKYINMPMRDLGRLREGRAHPLPVTTSLIVRGLKKLRAVGSSDPGHLSGMTLWRGMKHLRVGDGFAERGGTELAPMSTTVDAGVAVAYSSSECSLLFRLTTRNRLERGAEVGWVSAFPNESETLFPPLTFMQPTGQRQQIEVDGRKLTVVECSVTLAA